jgi:hypothetical protein
VCSARCCDPTDKDTEVSSGGLGHMCDAKSSSNAKALVLYGAQVNSLEFL